MASGDFSPTETSHGPPQGEGLPKQYRPADHELRAWAGWEASGCFHADPRRVLDGRAEPYAILIPPPNVTARLHLGHALNNTLQDVLVRAHRMRGFETLWMPGTDHAGIATQTVVDKRLQAEGKPSIRELKGTDGGRETFIGHVQAFKDEYEAVITDQLKRMGCSCDWDRRRFTMDKVCARAVREAFFRLFKEGLIYRGKRLVNWDPATQTALADDEVEMKEVEGSFWYLRYPLVHAAEKGDHNPVTWGELATRGYPGAEDKPDDQQAWVTVATTRPETYLGDTGVAMHPDDPRAGALEGLFAELPIVGRVIPIVRDDYVVMPDPESSDAKAAYATGFLKVTPAHDPNDWEIGQRHGLEVINVMAPDASISESHGWDREGRGENGHVFVGKSREEARELVVKEFEARGLLEATRPYTHSVGHSYRSHVPVEPYLSDQWYVRVTDDRLVGEAQRALAGEQRSDESLGGTALRAVSALSDRSLQAIADEKPLPRIRVAGFVATDPYPEGRPSPRNLIQQVRDLPHVILDGATYFITWRVASGQLTPEERTIVLDAIEHWHLDRWQVMAVVVMPDHVHVIARPYAGESLEALVGGVKKYSARLINKARGTEGSLWQPERFDHIVRDGEWLGAFVKYVVMNPVDKGLVASPEQWTWTRVQEAVVVGIDRVVCADHPRHSSESCATLSGHSSESCATLRFYPERYARTYESWHDNLRDWCISRQLWWGHRIPVWSLSDWESPDAAAQVTARLLSLARRGEIAFQSRSAFKAQRGYLYQQGADQGLWTHVCIRDPDTNSGVIETLESFGFRQDPDVLDTWFSSALWPMSTMGWPDPSQAPEFDGLLDAFNPTNVLCTAREIITLWVSRMVMFNRHLLGDSQGGTALRAVSGEGAPDTHPPSSESWATSDGRLPFKDVYIHPMIQDGHGQRMSKSLGNGVDPLDIIGSHGADAMRFVLAGIATATQDVRMPVDLVCPHCDHPFEPKWVTSPAGYKVAAPEQTCPKCAKPMVTSYGVATARARATDDAPLAGNTSSKFDDGQKFCNKLWNAARFAMMMLGEGEDADTAQSAVLRDELSLADRWMLSRLARASAQIDEAIATYQFSVYASTCYDLFWRDFCDWYLESIKPTIGEDPHQRAVLRAVLDAILRLLHPIVPFVTETIYGQVRPIKGHPVPGLALGEPRTDGLLATAPWPRIDADWASDEAETEYARIQALVKEIRDVRAKHKVAPSRKVTLHVHEDLAAELAQTGGLVQTLAGVATIAGPAIERAEDAVAFRFDDRELHLGDLADAVDAGAERQRLADQIAELDKSIKTLEGRLNNPGYVQKAPEKLVNQTRDQLDKARADRAASAEALERLG